MKTLLILVSLTASAGCAHLDTVGVDREANTVSIQASKWASETDVADKATEQCGGRKARLVRVEKAPTGRIFKINNSLSREIYRNVYTFSCGG